MKKTIIRCLLTIASAATLPAQAQNITCYTVRNSAGTLLEQSTSAPVDLSKPISQSVTEKYGPDSKLVMWPTDQSSCPDAASVAAASPGKLNTDTGNFGSYQASHLTSGYSSSYDSGSTYPSSYAHAGSTGSRRAASSYSNSNTHRSSYSSGSSSHSHSSGRGRGGRRR